MLTRIEKVIFLQDIDIFESTMTEDLAYIAAITGEVQYTQGETIFKEGDLPDAMYMVVDGDVKLSRDDDELMNAGPKDVFGTWALFDDEPRVVTAVALKNSRLLKIDRLEFIELLADHAQITQGILKSMARRLRNLMSRVRL
ncbi:MAG: Crp/Fnr family transcriptional regulator [candidate division KSB1 bacterium]|jgi:CRP-like cAMP-binding protein|nr:Crp/Fnr family transcriptional regulator [candidate division KSB1 bacterium]